MANGPSREVRSRIHAHVERPVSNETETALSIFELAGRNTQIKKRASNSANPKLVEEITGCDPIGCFLGTMLAREPTAEAKFDELKVRSETGLGAEHATGTTLTGGRTRGRAAAAATATMVPPL